MPRNPAARRHCATRAITMVFRSHRNTATTARTLATDMRQQQICVRCVCSHARQAPGRGSPSRISHRTGGSSRLYTMTARTVRHDAEAQGARPRCPCRRWSATGRRQCRAMLISRTQKQNAEEAILHVSCAKSADESGAAPAACCSRRRYCRVPHPSGNAHSADKGIATCRGTAAAQ